MKYGKSVLILFSLIAVSVSAVFAVRQTGQAQTENCQSLLQSNRINAAVHCLKQQNLHDTAVFKAAGHAYFEKANQRRLAFNINTNNDFDEILYADLNRAAFWYEKAARQGDVQAQYALGILYGELLPKQKRNRQKAIEWLQKSSAQGWAAAQMLLGEYYYEQGIRSRNARCLKQALQQFEKAKENHEAQAQQWIDEIKIRIPDSVAETPCV